MESPSEIDRLRRLNEHLIDRLAAAVEVLCRKSNGQAVPCPHCGEPIDWKRIVGERDAHPSTD